MTLISGCQVYAPEVDGAAAAEEAVPQQLPSPEKIKLPGSSDQIRYLAELKLAAKAPRETDNDDLLERLRSEFRLPAGEHEAIDIEFEWYRAHPDYLMRVFGRAERYLHHIAGELDRRGMPPDLALLPVVESAFDPFAYSHGRAAGLWQIIPGTGRRLGLKQNWWYDGRRDVVESTRAALDYLEALHDLFDGDWLLAVAGYNSGEGNVKRAIRRALAAGDPTDFWHIRRYLPVETRTYVPRLLAIRSLVAGAEGHGITLPAIPNAPYFDTVATGGQIDMALAASLADLPTDELYVLNPGVNRWATDPDGPHRLLVPVAKAAQLRVALADVGGRDRVEWSRHEVRAGETLGQLAEAYGTTAAVLRQVNGIRGDVIRIGQPVMIPHALNDLTAYTQSVEARLERRQNQERAGHQQTHEVRPGESLWSISRAYGVNVRELAVWNAMAPGDVLSIGRRLVVWTSQEASVIPARTERIRRVNYVVRRGDSLSRISRRFRVSVAELVRWNELSADQYLQPGQRLELFVDVTEQSI